jgi:hypothetical protein
MLERVDHRAVQQKILVVARRQMVGHGSFMVDDLLYGAIPKVIC